MTGLWGVALASLVYVAVVATIGLVSARRSASSPDEYFLAGRGLGPLVLFMALFGTNATSFVLVGIPGLAYHDGVGVFSVNAPIIALGIPLTFWAIGSPARAMAQRLGALTPAELYAKRFGSRTVGLVLFGAYTAYTIPYMVQAVLSSGTMLEASTDGEVSRAVGAVFVMAVALFYTSLGGMRGTAWTNVFQGAVFLVFMVAAFFLMASSMGGLVAATDAVREHDAGLLKVGEGRLFSPGAFTSWGLVISLTVIGFPHMLARLMAAEDQEALRAVCRMYPIALALLWVPAVMIGVWGAAAFPGLEGAASDTILYRMCAEHLPPLLGGLGFLAVLAAVMSTLDAQILTLSSMLVRDAAPRRLVSARDGGVRLGRVFSGLVAAVVLVLSFVWGESALFLGVRWRRATAAGLIASIAAGNVVLLLGWSGALTLDAFGFLPVFWALVGAIAAGVIVSLATRPDEARTTAAFGDGG